ncbi:hypothetical protein ACFRJ7_14915 [Streptomyces sp. NPDC056747]|uniref:hypothetical protein n=1 Tax=Streptomyces sp. NPDC056747 TaxID=3345935 RepID=UPI00367D5350
MKHHRSVDRLALAVSPVHAATAGPALAAGPAAALPAADGGRVGAAVRQKPTRPFVLAGDAQLWVSDDAVVVLPGKITKAPFSANVVATHVFNMLELSSVTGRPIDSYELITQGTV